MKKFLFIFIFIIINSYGMDNTALTTMITRPDKTESELPALAKTIRIITADHALQIPRELALKSKTISDLLDAIPDASEIELPEAHFLSASVLTSLFNYLKNGTCVPNKRHIQNIFLAADYLQCNAATNNLYNVLYKLKDDCEPQACQIIKDIQAKKESEITTNIELFINDDTDNKDRNFCFYSREGKCSSRTWKAKLDRCSILNLQNMQLIDLGFLKDIPEKIRNRIQILNVSHNQLTALDPRALQKIFPLLYKINASYNKIFQINNKKMELKPSINYDLKHTNYTHICPMSIIINLSENKITDETFPWNLFLFSHVNIDLSKNYLSSELCKKLIYAKSSDYVKNTSLDGFFHNKHNSKKIINYKRKKYLTNLFFSFSSLTEFSLKIRKAKKQYNQLNSYLWIPKYRTSIYTKGQLNPRRLSTKNKFSMSQGLRDLI